MQFLSQMFFLRVLLSLLWHIYFTPFSCRYYDDDSFIFCCLSYVELPYYEYNDRKTLIVGQPRRHLLTTGWSVFVSSKKLVAGDAFIFLRWVMIYLKIVMFSLLLFCFHQWSDHFLSIPRGENGELRVGVRRLMRQLRNMPSSVISSHSMHLGVLATASHAIATKTLFSVFYKPRFLLSL